MAKPTLQCLSLLFLAVATSLQATEALYLKFQYGGEWVNIATANLVDIFYSEPYGSFGDTGGAYQASSGGYVDEQVCLDGGANLPAFQITFDVTGKAAYGTEPDSGLTGWNFRDLLVHTMYDGILKIVDPTVWNVYVPKTTNECRFLHPCASSGSDCADTNYGHNIPSILRVNVFDDDGSLRPEFYEITLDNFATSSSSDGCSAGIEGFSIAAGLIPQVGGIVSAAVSILCLF